MQRESEILAAIRVAASQKGWRLWRNNSGVAYDARGVPVRFGLGNDSPQTNHLLKSGDLVGILPVKIQPCDVGMTFGIFTSLEIKRPGGHREPAQKAWIDLVNSLGGFARFVTGPEDLKL